MELVKIEVKDGKQLVSARELHEFLEVKSRFNDWIENRIEKYDFVENSDYTKLLVECIRGQNKYDYIITLAMSKELSMVENNEKGKLARKYFIECERKLMESVPKLPSNYKEALRELIKLEEEKEQLAIERDKAILTKAYISDKKTATAMNTASRLSKENHRLEIELDKSKEYSTIKRMELITGIKFNWRILKSACIDLGIEPIEVFDNNYGTVKSYHKDVWLEAYALNID